MENALFQHLLADFVLDVAITQCTLAKRRKLHCESCGYACQDHATGSTLATSSGRAADDSVVATKPENITLDCGLCSRKIASTRYAQHLSQCMGLTGRSGRSRNAKRGVAASSTPVPMDFDSDAGSDRLRKKSKLSGKPRDASRLSSPAPDTFLNANSAQASNLARSSSSELSGLYTDSTTRPATARKQMPSRPGAKQDIETISSNSSSSEDAVLSSDSGPE